jgi:hypothetical protein
VSVGLRGPGGLALFVSLVSLLAAPRAEAYVRYKTSKGVGFFWPQTCVPVSVYPASMTDVNGNMEMTPDAIVHAVTASAEAWSGGDNACTFIEVNVTASTDPTPTAGLDYTNAVIFRTTSWCAPTDPPGMCSYAPEALAITSVFVDKVNGRIIDGDIEVNSKGFIWTDLDTDPTGKGKQDLQNALTHEMGHLIGLDHTCFVAGMKGSPALDNKGTPVPNCDSAPQEVQATTMFASAIPGDVAKRTLAPDDIQAVCDIYPIAKDPMKCPVKDVASPMTACACATSGRGDGAGAARAVSIFGALALALSLRRRPRDRRT